MAAKHGLALHKLEDDAVTIDYPEAAALPEGRGLFDTTQRGFYRAHRSAMRQRRLKL